MPCYHQSWQPKLIHIRLAHGYMLTNNKRPSVQFIVSLSVYLNYLYWLYFCFLGMRIYKNYHLFSGIFFQNQHFQLPLGGSSPGNTGYMVEKLTLDETSGHHHTHIYTLIHRHGQFNMTNSPTFIFLQWEETYTNAEGTCIIASSTVSHAQN